MNTLPNNILTPSITMPKWLMEIEQAYLGKQMLGDETKLMFAIDLATENVRHQTGGPFGAGIFDIRTDELVAVGVNSVVPANQSWAHAEMTAFSHAQARLGTYDLKGCLLVTSCEPCAMCFGATPWSGVEKLIYGAEGDAARKVGFDEGDKATNWQNALEQRGICVVGPLLKEKSEAPFELYRSMSGIVY